LACPYFIPEKRCETELWTHRARLPLGDGYEGRCSAPGFEAERPTEDDLKSGCNLGNACCSRLPKDRDADSVRFHVASDQGSALIVDFCTERDHRPREHGVLQFDATSGTFVEASSHAAVLRLAQAFLQSYMQRHPRAQAAKS
jgi:hypothetical protein